MLHINIFNSQLILCVDHVGVRMMGYYTAHAPCPIRCDKHGRVELPCTAASISGLTTPANLVVGFPELSLRVLYCPFQSNKHI